MNSKRRKIQQENLLLSDKFPDDCLASILQYITEGEDYLNIILTAKHFYNIGNIKSWAFENVVFKLHSKRDVKLFSQPFVRNVKIFNKDVTDEDLIEIFKKCKQLRRLDLSDCGITDAVLIALSKECKQLKKLNLEGCDGIADYTRKTLKLSLPNLVIINIE